MKYKGIILIVLIILGVLVLRFMPGDVSRNAEIAAVGSPAPDFELQDLNGNIWRLSGLKGKVVFVNFWASWCPSCNTETQYKEILNKTMQGKPFQMLGVLYRDDPADAIAYIQKHGLTFPSLRTNDDTVARHYGITGIPETFIIDKDGIVREKIVGPRQWDLPESVALVEKWL